MAHGGTGVLAGTVVILRSRWHIARNIFWGGRLLRKIGILALVLAACAVSYGLYRLSRGTVRALQELARDDPALLREVGCRTVRRS